MVWAVVLAGGRIKKKLNFFENLKLMASKKLTDMIYREDYMWGDVYKPLKEVEGMIDNELKPRPMVCYPIKALDNSKLVSGIVVVGEKEGIENCIKEHMPCCKKEIKVIQQRGEFLDNILIGDENCPKGKKLFMTSDVVAEKPENIDVFINSCSVFDKDFDVIFPIVSKESLMVYEGIFMRRRYFWIIDDSKDVSMSSDRYRIDAYGRRGYRIGSMVMADIDMIKNKARIQKMYNMRKLVNFLNSAKILIENKEFAVRYVNKQLRWSDVNRIVSNYIGARFRLLEIDNPASALDCDSRQDMNYMSKIIRERKI